MWLMHLLKFIRIYYTLIYTFINTRLLNFRITFEILIYLKSNSYLSFSFEHD